MTALDGAYAVLRALKVAGEDHKDAQCIVDMLLKEGAVEFSARPTSFSTAAKKDTFFSRSQIDGRHL